MRVLLICIVYPPEIAPAGVMTRELAEDLVAAGHDVTVLTGWPNYPEGKLFEGYKMRWRSVTEHVDGYRVIRVRHSLPDRKSFRSRIRHWRTFAVSSFLKIVFSRRYDVIYSHSTPIVGTFMTALACGLKRTKYLYGVYDLYPEAAAEVGTISRGWLYRICRAIDTWVCRRADSIPTLSEGIRKTIMARGIPGEKIPVMPFWIDAEKLKPLSRNNPWRREHDIAPDVFVVLYAGTIGNISGAEVMLDVAEAMRDDPSTLFLFVGEGVVKDRLITESANRKLKNMRFLPFQPAEGLAEMQATADVGMITLLPGTGRNSIPSKMLGYLAAGRAVLASADGDSDTCTCIRDARCGLTVPSQDAGAIVEAVRKLKAPGLAREFGRVARRYFLEHFSRSVNTARYEALLTEICHRNRVPEEQAH